MRDARCYVELAERSGGPVPAPAGPDWPWGEALEVLERAAPDVRILNLETAVTADGDFAAGKAVHYRMHPANLPALTVARPDVCVLANNHVLDFGRGAWPRPSTSSRGRGCGWPGPAVTPRPRTPGRGARRPARPCPRLRPRHGVQRHPAELGGDRPAVRGRLPARADGRRRRGPAPTRTAGPAAGDVVVVSVHWGSNWGHRVPAGHVRFAHALVEGGVDVVHGHSSHHPRPSRCTAAG